MRQHPHIDGCYVHDVNADGSVGGDFIDVRNGVHPSIVVKNSTFYACARTFLRVSDNADSGLVEVKNNTFNYVTTTKTPKMRLFSLLQRLKAV